MAFLKIAYDTKMIGIPFRKIAVGLVYPKENPPLLEFPSEK